MKKSLLLYVFILITFFIFLPSIKWLEQDSRLVGKWTICGIVFSSGNKSEKQESQESFNVCPTIYFIQDHTGYTSIDTSPKPSFTWTSSGDQVVIKQIHKGKTNGILSLDGTFKIISPNNKKFKEIDLINKLNTSEQLRYILGR